MTIITGFCDGSTSGLEQEISRYVKLFNSGNCLDVSNRLDLRTILPHIFRRSGTGRHFGTNRHTGLCRARLDSVDDANRRVG
jgi:hypothetical protein